LKTLRSRMPLKALIAPPLVIELSKLKNETISSTVETITIMQSNRLNRSFAYPFAPSPISLIIISVKNNHDNILFAISLLQFTYQEIDILNLKARLDQVPVPKCLQR
jgi:hypothetical protein